MTSKAAARQSSRQLCGLHLYTPWGEMRQHAVGEAFGAPSLKSARFPGKIERKSLFFMTFSDV
ncbi:MAG: hypothetical protein ABSG10_02785 [Terracidiphilus sp.]|jgi:hypothetical protein